MMIMWVKERPRIRAIVSEDEFSSIFYIKGCGNECNEMQGKERESEEEDDRTKG
jgi:hypothetical protein